MDHHFVSQSSISPATRKNIYVLDGKQFGFLDAHHYLISVGFTGMEATQYMKSLMEHSK